MIRNCSLCLAAAVLFISVGCEKSAEPRARARVAKAGLMPTSDPAAEPIYVADQGNVKLAPARTVSFESLDTFRERNAARAEARLAGDQNEDAAADSEDATDNGDEAVEADESEDDDLDDEDDEDLDDDDEDDDDLDDEDEDDDLDDDEDDLDDDDDLDDEDDDDLDEDEDDE